MPIKIAKKKTFSDWITVEGVRFKLDYPSLEQSHEINQLIIKAYTNPAEASGITYDLACRYIGFVVKGWEGLVDDEGEKIACKIIDNELQVDLRLALTGDINQAMTLYQAFKDALDMTEGDKKK